MAKQLICSYIAIFQQKNYKGMENIDMKRNSIPINGDTNVILTQSLHQGRSSALRV